MPELSLILTCEHGGNTVPEPYGELFRGQSALLENHRGWDPGALPLARHLAKSLNAPLFHSTVTRLLVDLNRSTANTRLFSEFSRKLTSSQKNNLVSAYYLPFRTQVGQVIGERLARCETVLHLSVHTFTPVLEGRARNADIGLLYDPRRQPEQAFCRRLKSALQGNDPSLRVRFNYPYRGVSDGHTTALRKIFPERYLGLELEVSQSFPLGDTGHWTGLQRRIAGALGELVREARGR